MPVSPPENSPGCKSMNYVGFNKIAITSETYCCLFSAYPCNGINQNRSLLPSFSSLRLRRFCPRLPGPVFGLRRVVPRASCSSSECYCFRLKRGIPRCHFAPAISVPVVTLRANFRIPIYEGWKNIPETRFAALCTRQPRTGVRVTVL